MSRFVLACSLIAALSSGAVAARAVDPVAVAPHIKFAEPASPALRMPGRVLDRATGRAKLVAARAANLARFRAYQRGGVFPSNSYTDDKLNVWIDADGHLCAAATIIKASGHGDLVARVADQNNFIKLGDVTQGPLMDWILTSGFTQAEIAAIQEPFMPVVQEPGTDPVIVDGRMRRTEDQRLRARYKQVEAMLVRNQRASLELAVDRLMARPGLAWSLVDG
jgi:hypothetical protein